MGRFTIIMTRKHILCNSISTSSPGHHISRKSPHPCVLTSCGDTGRGRNSRPAPAKTGSNLRLAGSADIIVSQKSRFEISLSMKIFLCINVLPAWFDQIRRKYYKVISNSLHYTSMRLMPPPHIPVINTHTSL